MANPNLTRTHQKIFSENAANNGQFGSLQSGTKVETPDISVLQALAAYQEGWSDAVISGEELPSLEEFNGLHKIETEQLQYLLNKGIPEYSADAEYYIGDIQREVGGTKLYKSITNNNIGNALTDIANWEIYYDPDNGVFDNVTINNKLNTQPNAATILNNEITCTGAYMVIDTEGGAATDDLDTINGGNDGDKILISINNSARKITIRDDLTSGGNISIPSSYNNEVFLSFSEDFAEFIFKSGFWLLTNIRTQKDFLSSKTTNGYTYLPNGLIMQWGRVIVGTTPATIIFPISFTNPVFNITLGIGESVPSSRIAAHSNKTNSSFDLVANISGTAVEWQAIGY